MTEVFNNSDHHYIQFDMDASSGRDRPSAAKEIIGWNTSGGIELDSFHCGLLVAKWLEDRQGIRNTESEAQMLEDRITSACDFTIPR